MSSLVRLRPVLADIEIGIELAFEVEVILNSTHSVLTGLADIVSLFGWTRELDLVMHPSVELDVEVPLLEQLVHLEQPLLAH